MNNEIWRQVWFLTSMEDGLAVSDGYPTKEEALVEKDRLIAENLKDCNDKSCYDGYLKYLKSFYILDVVTININNF